LSYSAGWNPTAPEVNITSVSVEIEMLGIAVRRYEKLGLSIDKKGAGLVRIEPAPGVKSADFERSLCTAKLIHFTHGRCKTFASPVTVSANASECTNHCAMHRGLIHPHGACNPKNNTWCSDCKS
jgi:hypothetical protein